MVLFCVYFKCLVYFHSFHVVPTSFSLAPNDFKDFYSWWCSRNKTFTHTTDRCIWWICCMSQYSFYFVLFSLSLTRLVSFTGKESGSNTRLQQWLQKSRLLHTSVSPHQETLMVLSGWWGLDVGSDWKISTTIRWITTRFYANDPQRMDLAAVQADVDVISFASLYVCKNSTSRRDRPQWACSQQLFKDID